MKSWIALFIFLFFCTSICFADGISTKQEKITEVTEEEPKENKSAVVETATKPAGAKNTSMTATGKVEFLRPGDQAMGLRQELMILDEAGQLRSFMVNFEAAKKMGNIKKGDTVTIEYTYSPLKGQEAQSVKLKK